MSETVLRILLGELTTLRIVCKQCRASVEVSVGGLDRQNRSSDPQRGVEIRCPGCGLILRSASQSPSGVTDHFDRLATALAGLLAEPNAEFQFIISTPTAKS